jgi:hypothetical protein
MCYNSIILKEGDNMRTYKSIKGSGFFYILGITILYNAIIIVLLNLVNSYVIFNILKAIFVLCNLYQLYYIGLSLSLKYVIDDKFSILALGGLKKISIPYDKIQGYKKSEGKIKGVKLSGYGSDNFALGKFVINKIGATSMFATSSKEIFYLNVEEMNYAVSPVNSEEFTKDLATKGIPCMEWEARIIKNNNLYKEKKFIIPFIAVTVIIIILILNPFILYLKGKLPGQMPLNFDSAFIPLERGTGKQFAFSQMVYGVLNMAILICMYYASYFYSKYDKKSAPKFIYISLIIAVLFLVMQFRILFKFG